MTETIDGWFPSPEKYINNELATLKYITQCKTINEYCKELYRDAINTYSSIKEQIDILSNNRYKDTSHKEKRLGFESYFELNIHKLETHSFKKAFAWIGFIIFLKDIETFNGISHYIAIVCESDDNKKVIRKYHFDYTTKKLEEGRQPHPCFHFQYPGELTPALKREVSECGYSDECLSEPRILFFPMSLSLLLNMLFNEFPSDQTDKIKEEAQWRELIRKDEDLLLFPYFEKCFHFKDRRDKRLFTGDFCYGR
jgi:hypothetical protein